MDFTLSGETGDTLSLYQNANPAPVLLASARDITASLAPGVDYIAEVSGGHQERTFHFDDNRRHPQSEDPGASSCPTRVRARAADR